MTTDQLTPEKLAAIRRGQIGAALRREQRTAEEAREQALGGRLKAKMKGKSAMPGEVPPFCYLAGGRSPEEAAFEAFKHFSMTLAEALGLVWKLRTVRQADRLFAEELAHRTDERSVITPGHRGQTEPAREEEGKGRLGLSRQTVAVSGQPNQLSKGQRA